MINKNRNPEKVNKLAVGSTATPADGELILGKNLAVSRTGGKAFVQLEKTGEASKFLTAAGVSTGAFSIIDENAGGGSDVANTRLTIDSAGQVGIGVAANIGGGSANNTFLSVKGKVAAYGGVVELANYGTSDNGQTLGAISYYDNTTKNAEVEVTRESAADDAKMVFKTKPTGGSLTARLSISSAGLCSFSNGIAFQSATSSTESGVAGTGYTLDKYEVGTCTPTITGGSVAGTHSGILRRGDYVRVGNICTVSGYYYGTSGTGSGDLILGGLPFSVSGSTVAVGNIQANAGVVFAAGSIPAWITGGGTLFKVRQTFLDGSAFTYAAYPTDPSYLRFTITYITA